MSDTTTTEPITLQAFVPAELRIGDNARTDAEATITKEWVAQLKEHAKHSPISFPHRTGRWSPAGTTPLSPSSAARTARLRSCSEPAEPSAVSAPGSTCSATSRATRATTRPPAAPGCSTS